MAKIRLRCTQIESLEVTPGGGVVRHRAFFVPEAVTDNSNTPIAGASIDGSLKIQVINRSENPFNEGQSYLFGPHVEV